MLTAGSLIATFVAGLLSFFSPCTVPLMPAYLACVSGVSVTELNAEASGGHRFGAKLIAGSVLYVLGFAVVFVVSGTIIGGFGSTLAPARGAAVVHVIELIGGTAMVVFGLTVAGVLRWRRLFGERRVELPQRLRGGGVAAAFPLGVVFGLAWTPCVGGYLSAALTLAALSATASSGAALLFVYACGIGLPFILVALAWASLPTLPNRLRRAAGPLTRAGGVLTAALGVLILSGGYTHLTSWLVQFSVPH